MKFFTGGKPQPSSWDLLEDWLDELIFDRFWKRFKRRSKKFLIKPFVVVLALIYLVFLFVPYRVSGSLILSVPGVHETYEWLFLNKNEKVLAGNIRKQLGYFGGNLALSFMYSLDDVKTEKERKQTLDNENCSEPQITGFEIINIPNEKLADVLRGTIPKGFLFNVKKIIYKDWESVNPVVIYYGFSFRPISSANPFTKNITVFYQWKTIEIKSVRTILTHEIAHLNDWNSNALLTRQERLKLFCDILERVGAGDRYLSCYYVEEINPKNESLKKYMRATEYWAEINEVYFGSAEKSFNLPQKDREIVEDVLQKMDSCYFQKIQNWQCQPY